MNEQTYRIILLDGAEAVVKVRMIKETVEAAFARWCRETVHEGWVGFNPNRIVLGDVWEYALTIPAEKTEIFVGKNKGFLTARHALKHAFEYLQKEQGVIPGIAPLLMD